MSGETITCNTKFNGSRHQHTKDADVLILWLEIRTVIL